MAEQQLSDEFLAKVREVYQESHPVFVQLLQEQKQLKTWIAMLKVSVEINGEGDSTDFTGTLTQILTHFDKVAGVIAAHDGLAMMVNAATAEHQETQ